MSVRARAWTALLLPPLAWFVFEQGLSHVLHLRCGLTVVGLGGGVLSLAACALAAWLAHSLSHRVGDRPNLLADLWLARLALVLAGMFALAIAFQTLAIAMVPPCVG